MTHLLVVMLGGAIGSGARYLVVHLCNASFTRFPVGTLAVNVVGCLLIGILGHLFAGATGMREVYRYALIVGVLGGFTTFSSFGQDTVRLAEQGQLAAAALNVALNNVLGLAAVVIGAKMAQQMWPAG